MQLVVPVLGQRDPQWANIPLGTSSNTIGQDGCAITCLTMVLQYYRHNIDVAGLNHWLTLNDGYTNADWVNWDAITRYANDVEFIGDVNCASTPAPIDTINQELQKGYPVLIGVNFNHNSEEVTHYVLIVGVTSDGVYIINDPWTQDQVLFNTRYAVNGLDQSQAILQVLFYHGTSTNIQPAPPSTDTTQPNPQPATINEMSLQDVMVNVYHALCGVDASQDEINYKINEIQGGKPLSSVMEDILRGDSRAQTRWFQPAIDAYVAAHPQPTPTVTSPDTSTPSTVVPPVPETVSTPTTNTDSGTTSPETPPNSSSTSKVDTYTALKQVIQDLLTKLFG